MTPYDFKTTNLAFAFIETHRYHADLLELPRTTDPQFEKAVALAICLTVFFKNPLALSHVAVDKFIRSFEHERTGKRGIDGIVAWELEESGETA